MLLIVMMNSFSLDSTTSVIGSLLFMPTLDLIVSCNQPIYIISKLLLYVTDVVIPARVEDPCTNMRVGLGPNKNFLMRYETGNYISFHIIHKMSWPAKDIRCHEPVSISSYRLLSSALVHNHDTQFFKNTVTFER